MSSKRRKKLEARLDRMDGNERLKLYKRASKLRKAERDQQRPRRASKSISPQSWDDMHDEVGGRPVRRVKRRGAASIDDWVERLLLEEGGADVAELEGEHAGPTADALVVSVASGRCRCRDERGDELDVFLPPHIAATQQTDVAVGDRVVFREASEKDGRPALVEMVLPRRTTLSRPDPGGRGAAVERVLAANVDVVVVVVSGRTPPLRPALIDRFLIAVERGGAAAAVCLNKVDLLEPAELAERLDDLRPFADLGHAVVACSAASGEGLDALRAVLAEKLCVFVGQSGVGKSSLLNALRPELDLATQETGETTRKGRHTTTASSLYDLGGGAAVIDTPGVREFGLWKLAAEELRAYFHEFDAWAAQCRYGDCSHVHEPECAVRRAVEAGDIAVRRYEAYARIWHSIR